MAVTQFTKNMGIIAALDDEPNDAGGLSATQLKAKFDEGGAALKTYINETLIPSLIATNIGYTDTTGGGIPVTTVSGALALLYTQIVNTVLGSIPDGSITATQLATDSIITAKIEDEAVTAAKILSSDWDSKADLDANSKVLATETSSHITAVTTSKTLALADAGTFQNCTNSTAITVSIPANADVAFPVGTELEVYRGGAGTVTIAALSGVTIRCTESTYAISDQYATACLKKIAADTWLLQGAVG